ncbi:hypothetical protein A2U01_0006546 [Trifolium medium]|uniref:Uncharacterized protein n=1 Tax=Trifolium medium TaxID=97028 RepID=A0A392MDU3_9FABA|nr:hypothetical protein [Trifolium medium]
MGACVRNEEGQFITTMSAHINAVRTPAEAWSLQQGSCGWLCLAIEM